MKTSLSEIEQSNLKTRGILKQNEIAYRENGLMYAEDVISGTKRIINSVSSPLKEGKVLLG